MTTRVDSARNAGVSVTMESPTKRVLLVVPRTPIWADVARAIQAEQIECAWVPDTATPESVAAELQQAPTVLIVDLGPDPVRGMTMVTTCRRRARTAPVVVVAADPSIELARRIRLSGVFYLALDPVSTEEIGSVVDNAFQCLARHRADTSVYRVKPRILIVDDDADFVTSMSTLLDSQGYAVSVARSGKDALEKVRTDTPDLFVLDIMMEYDSSGYEVNQALKFGSAFECFRHIPILMVSSIQVDPMTRFKMAGEVDLVTPDGYITKPVDIPKFLQTVESLLGERPEPATP